jgi:hypothetical protein
MGEWEYSSTILVLGSGRRWVVSFTPQPFTPRQKNPVRTGRNVRWAPEPVWTLCSREKSLVPTGNRTQTVQAVVIPTELSRIPFIFVMASNYCTYYRSKVKSDRKMGYMPFNSTKIHTSSLFIFSAICRNTRPGVSKLGIFFHFVTQLFW